MAIAEKFEEVSRRRLGEAQARRVIQDIYQLAHGEPLDSSTVRDFLSSWLARKKLETAPNTFAKYRSVIAQFQTFLGDRGSKDLNLITRKFIADFRDQLAARLSAPTANLALKILRVAFKQAQRDGLLQTSPAELVPVLSLRDHESVRRPFELDELRRLYRHADGEWTGLILFGLYSGQRLKDIATLRRGNFDFGADHVRFRTHKTRRHQVIPLIPPLREIATARFALPGDRADWLFPIAAEAVAKTGDVRRLSAAFSGILAAAGLAKPRSQANTGTGRSVRRATSELSFHCLRYTATSLMKNAGANSSVVQDLIGHDSAATSALYTRIDETSKRRAMELIPDITGGDKVPRNVRRVRG